ncbi:hypothetical protein D3C78_1391770 [compost metagenome]
MVNERSISKGVIRKMKYIIIENLMGGVAWIIEEYDNEAEATAEYKKIDSKATNNSFQLMSLESTELARLIEEGKLDYL